MDIIKRKKNLGKVLASAFALCMVLMMTMVPVFASAIPGSSGVWQNGGGTSSAEWSYETDTYIVSDQGGPTIKLYMKNAATGASPLMIQLKTVASGGFISASEALALKEAYLDENEISDFEFGGFYVDIGAGKYWKGASPTTYSDGETPIPIVTHRTFADVMTDAASVGSGMWSVAGSIVTFITSHPLALITVALMLIGTAIMVIRRVTQGV